MKMGTLQTTNLLNERYNSWVPYAFDDARAVKYSWVPCSDRGNPAFNANDSSNFLGERVKTDLKAKAGCFKLVAQFHEDGMPSVEEAIMPWGAPESRKYVELAELSVPAKFTSENFCQSLSFNPAHALPNQRGVGTTQRARRIIYATIANTRITNSEAPSAD